MNKNNISHLNAINPFNSPGGRGQYIFVSIFKCGGPSTCPAQSVNKVSYKTQKKLKIPKNKKYFLIFSYKNFLLSLAKLL